MKAEFANEVRQTLPIRKIIGFLKTKYGEIFYDRGEFWTVAEQPRMVALLKEPYLILPSTNGMETETVPIDKIPEYKRKYYNLFYCLSCGSYCTSHFLAERCPKGHPLRLITSTFTYVEVRPRQPLKQEVIDPEIQFAKDDMKKAQQLSQLRKILRRQSREEARRETLKKELQTQVPKAQPQQQQEERGPFQHFLNHNVVYIKNGRKYYLTLEQRIKFWSALGEPVSIPTAPQVADEVVNERESPLIPVSIEDEYETLLPSKSLKAGKPRHVRRQKQGARIDVKRYKDIPWERGVSIRMQSPQLLSQSALLQQEQQEQRQEQHDRQITADEFKQKYQLYEVTSLPNGGYKGIKWISFRGSLVKLTFYSFMFRPSGRNVNEFTPEQVTLAAHLANQMGGQVIVSEDKKYSNISLCVLLGDATIVIARRSIQ